MKLSSVAPWVILAILLVSFGTYAATQQTRVTPQPQNLPTVTAPQSIEKVDLILSYIATGEFTPFYAAVDHGFFAKYALDVNILPNPQGSAAAIRALASKKADFAQADVGTLITLSAKEHITNVRAVALVYRTSPMAVLYLEGKDRPTIKVPKDLEGKTLGTPQGGAIVTLFPVFAKLNGIDLSKVNIVYASSSTLSAGLLTGKFDGLMVFPRAKADLEVDAAKQGYGIGLMLYADYGLNIYANMILTRTDIIENKPDVVRRFIQGYIEALRFSAAEPHQAVDSVLKFNPQLNANETYGEWVILEEYMGGKFILNATNPLSLGWIEPGRMDQTIKTITAAYNVTAPDASAVYTDKFVQPPRP